MKESTKSFTSKLKSFIVFCPVFLVWWAFKLVPKKCAFNVGYHIGRGAFSVFRTSRHARVSIDNLIIVGLAKTQAEAYTLAQNSAGHFIGHLFEVLRTSECVTRDNWREHVKLRLSPATEKALFNPTSPILLATGHLGAWEAGVSVITSIRPFYAIARMMDNPYIQRFLERHNFRAGATIISKKHGFSTSFFHTWEEENAAFAILFDQFSSGGVPCDFFGYKVPIYTSPARVHLKTGAPIIVGGFIRTGYLQYEMIAIGDPIVYTPTDNRDQDVATITQDLIQRFEQVVRMAPEQYLWSHRRWRGIAVPKVPQK